MVGGQDRDSSRKSGRDETPQERMRRGGSSPAESEVLHGNQQRCNKSSILDHLSHLFVYRSE
ncbi:hypothetical protein ABEU98_11765 [Priestia megaterium]|uniref:hypothetical protein n=1 Tax=Priestia megaterium TaxID=1404 RepID=UPI001144FC8C|nr:hypothetical protein [Priestia megaterium]MBZ5480830.1 hypothetical protein [Bacillus sp. T_4]QDZ84894.1 hypothetical protein D0441_10765 [Priestia megaterium]